MSISETNQMFQAMFDMRLEGAIVYFPIRAGYLPAPKHAATADIPGQFIRLDDSTTHLLLGKNGSGKTILLRGLEQVSRDEEGFPSVSLLFKVPDNESFQRWELAKADVEAAGWFREIVEEQQDETFSPVEALSDATDLRLARRFAVSLAYYAHGSAVAWEFPMTPEEILGHIGLGHLAITPDVQSVNPRNYVAEFVIGSYARHMSRWSENGLGRRVPMEEWFESPTLSDLTGRAVAQFCASLSHIEYFGGGSWFDGGSFRLLAEFPDSGPLAEFMRRVEDDWKKADERNEFLLSVGRSRRFFPHAMFDVVTIGDRQMVASSIIRSTHPETEHSDGIVSVTTVSPDGSATEKATSVLWSLFAGQRVATTRRPGEGMVADGDTGIDGISLSLTVDAHVIRFLDDVGKSLGRCGLGIDGLRMSFSRLPDPEELMFSYEPRDLRSDKDFLAALRKGKSLMEMLAETEGILLNPRLEWHDVATDTWRILEHASLGQLQVILLMLRLHFAVSTNFSMSGHDFVLGDEFDRNLHPEATKMVLAELQHIVSGAERLTVILSTHSVQPLGMAPLASIQRIYSENSAGHIRYTSSSDVLRSTVEDVLGTSALDAWKLKRVHVLLEGLHDVMVLQDILSNQIPEIRDVNLINGNGVNGWSGVFANLLRFMNAPVLLVYDKRNSRLEDAWTEVRSLISARRQIPNWGKTPLAPLLDEVRSRRKGALAGDHELRQVLTVLQKQVLGRRDIDLALRVHLFGLEREDIVDYLPIASFPEALKFGSDWAAVHNGVRKKFGPHVSGERFKELVRINEKSVQRAISDNLDRVEPELGDLVNMIRRLISLEATPDVL